MPQPSPASPADRATLLDEGLPKAVGEIDRHERPAVALTALARQRRHARARDRHGRPRRQVASREGHHHDPPQRHLGLRAGPTAHLEGHRLGLGTLQRRHHGVVPTVRPASTTPTSNGRVTPRRRSARSPAGRASPSAGCSSPDCCHAAWLALGDRRRPKGAIWFQVTKIGTSEYSGAPTEPFFFLVLGNDGRTDDDKGLGDAIHVIGMNPAHAPGDHPQRATATRRRPAATRSTPTHALERSPRHRQRSSTDDGDQDQLRDHDQLPGLHQRWSTSIGGIDINIPPMTEGDNRGTTSSPARSSSPGPSTSTGTQALALLTRPPRLRDRR